MKIAITGHTAGIGQALTKVLSARGHEVVGLSRRTGNNIRVTPKTIESIVDCDMFINNAQAGFAQTELLYAIWEQWQGQAKTIWCISSMMVETPTDTPVPGHSSVSINAYRNQKVTLEEACQQLLWKNHSPHIAVIRPGAIATQQGQVPGDHYADVDAWANMVVSTFVEADQLNMRISNISLGPSHTYRLSL